MRPRVVLFREPSPPDPYEALLEQEGYVVVHVPVLHFELTPAENLTRTLDRPEAFTGLIVTSPRAVRALASVPSTTRMPWLPKACWAVGPRTSAALRREGFAPEGKASGSGAALARALLAAHPEPSRWLFLTGTRRGDALPDQLREAGHTVEEVVVYRTVPRPDLTRADIPAADAYAFFSPSGIEPVERSGGREPAAAVLAIGPTTAAALEEAGVRVDAVAPAPDPQGLLAALQRAGVRPDAS